MTYPDGVQVPSFGGLKGAGDCYVDKDGNIWVRQINPSIAGSGIAQGVTNSLSAGTTLSFAQSLASQSTPGTALLLTSQPNNPPNPNDGNTHQPYELYVSTGYWANNGGYYDPQCTIGYNPRKLGTEPTFVVSWEADYTNGTQRTLEWYCSANQTGNANPIRPFGYVYNVVTGATTVNISWQGGTFLTLQQDGVDAIYATKTGLTFQNPGGQVNITNPSDWMRTNGTNVAHAATNGDFYLYSSGGTGVGNLGANYFQFLGQGLSATRSALLDLRAGQFSFYPNADNTGSVGTASNRWALVRATVVTSGDLDLCDEEHGAHWTIREEPDALVAVNRMTDEWFEVPMVKLSPERRAAYEAARPLKTAKADPGHIARQKREDAKARHADATAHLAKMNEEHLAHLAKHAADASEHEQSEKARHEDWRRRQSSREEPTK